MRIWRSGWPTKHGCTRNRSISGLERLRAVLERLRWRQPTVPVITVAGTNGKGSVRRLCDRDARAPRAIEVGTFTSPHLRDYRERIRMHDAWRERRCTGGRRSRTRMPKRVARGVGGRSR